MAVPPYWLLIKETPYEPFNFVFRFMGENENEKTKKPAPNITEKKLFTQFLETDYYFSPFQKIVEQP